MRDFGSRPLGHQRAHHRPQRPNSLEAGGQVGSVRQQNQDPVSRQDAAVPQHSRQAGGMQQFFQIGTAAVFIVKTGVGSECFQVFEFQLGNIGGGVQVRQ